MKSPKQITEHDILIFLEESFPTINRGGDIHQDFAQIMGQHGMMLSILHSISNDTTGERLENFRKSIEDVLTTEHCIKSISKVLAAKRKRVTR